ncbi:MAG: hypothetical protein ACJA00_003963 [Myxococcota bacterium]|jgi:hypothetical protein
MPNTSAASGMNRALEKNNKLTALAPAMTPHPSPAVLGDKGGSGESDIRWVEPMMG